MEKSYIAIIENSVNFISHEFKEKKIQKEAKI